MPLWWLRFRGWLHVPPHIVQFADGSYGLKRCCFGPLFRELQGSRWCVHPWPDCRTKDEALIRRVAEDPWNVGIEVAFPLLSERRPPKPTPRPLARRVEQPDLREPKPGDPGWLASIDD